MVNIINSIKSKKEFATLDDAFVKEKLDSYFLEHKNLKKKLDENNYNERSSAYKQVVKDIRSSLREVYGVFQRISSEKKYELLNKFFVARGRNERVKILNKLLSSHQSTFERKDDYETVYKEIFQKIDEPKTILDLGCGLNPLTYNFIGFDPDYFCCDISTDDMNFIQTFFDKEHIKGEAFKVDLLSSEERKKYFKINADVVFMFKLIDTLESQIRNVNKTIIKELIDNIKPKNIVISFPTKSIGGRTFRNGRKENWFSRFLKEESIKWNIFSIEGEEFWILTL